MSFFSDLFKGNWSNLGEDLAPSNIFKDFGSSFANQPTWAKALEIALPAVALGGVGLGALADVGVAGAAGGASLAGAEAAGAGAGELSGLTAADVTFLDPTLTAADFAAGTPGAAAAIPEGSAAFPATSELVTGPANPFIAGTEAVPFQNMTLGGGFPSIEGGPGTGGVFDFSPSTEIATGGNVIPNISAATGGGAGGGATGASVAADAPNVFGPAPGVFQTGTSAVPFGGADAGAAAAGAAPAAGGGGGILSTLGGALKTAAPWLGAAGLGANLWSGYQSSQRLKAIQQQEADYQNKIAGAGQASLSAAQPLLAGGLSLEQGGPGGSAVEAMLDRYRQQQRAGIIQGYGSRNQNTDPKQNSALQQDLDNVETNVLMLREQIGKQFVDQANTMLAAGVSATQIAARIPIMMQQLDLQLQQLTGNSIANFAAAMSGGTMKVAGIGSGQNINLNLGNTLGSTSV